MPLQTITKAIIPAAGLDTRLMPASLAVPKAMFPIAQSDGCVRPVIHIIIREALAAGIEQIAIVVPPGGEDRFAGYFRDHGNDPRLSTKHRTELADIAGRITYVTQPQADGFGHAVWCAREFAAGEPVLVMLGDHIYRNDPAGVPVVSQVLECFELLTPKSLVGVMTISAEQLGSFGVVAGEPVKTGDDLERRLFGVRAIAEKPDLETARTKLRTPGLIGNRFLGHCGLYGFDNEIFDILDELVTRHDRSAGEIQLTTAQQQLLSKAGDTYALRVAGKALDMGNPAALVKAQAAFGR